MPTFDGVNLIMTLDAPVNGVSVINVGELYSAWKAWMLSSSQNQGYPPAFRTIGGDPLSSIINAGTYYFLRNDVGWRIRPPEEDGTYYFLGNLAVQDTEKPAIVPTAGPYTVAILGLQPVTQGVVPQMKSQLEYGSFNGAVHIDVLNGEAGTGLAADGEPLGNTAHPVNNVADATAILQERGFDELHVFGDITLNGGLDFSDLIIQGQGKTLSEFTILSSANVLNTTFKDATVTGVLDGMSRIIDSRIIDLHVISGEIERCTIEPGTFTLSNSGVTNFLDCFSGVPGTGTPVIDMGGAGQALSMRNYNGGIKLINKTGPENVSIDLNSGQVIVDLTTVTNGTIVVRGVGKLLDQNGNFIDSGTYGSLVIVNETLSSYVMDVIRDHARAANTQTKRF